MLHLVVEVRGHGRGVHDAHIDALALELDRDRAATWDMNAFVAPYIIAKGFGMYAEALEVKTMHPFFWFLTMSEAKWCVMASAAVALHSMFTRCLPRGWESKKPVTMKPALLKTS